MIARLARRGRVFVLAAVVAAMGAAEVAAAAGIAPLGADFEVTPPAPGVGVPSICARSDGGFVLARSQGSETGGQILLRRLNAQGKAEADDFVASTYDGGVARGPDVACDSDGGFAVVWTDHVPPATDEDVLARVFDASGVALGDPFLVNEHTTGNQNDGAVCALGDGAFAVIWQDRNRDEVDTRVVTKDGATSDPVQVVEDPRTFMRPDVACSAGKFLVVWGDFPSPALNDEVEGRLFAADGAAVASRFFVNSYTTGDQGYPVACGAGDDGFIVAWRNAPNRRGAGNVKARRFSTAGTPLGAGFDVSPEGRDRAELLCGAGGSFVVTTHSSVDGEEALHAQAVSQDRELLGNEAVLHEGTTALGDAAPPLAGDASGKFLVVWPAFAPVDNESVRGRFFRAGADVTTTSLTTTTTLPGATSTTVPGTTTTVPAGEDVCGDAVSPTGASAITIADALAVLRAAVGNQPCELCRCDTNGSGTVTVEDALRILSRAVGLVVDLVCPAC